MAETNMPESEGYGAATYGAASQALASGRPSHIVVYREASEKTVSRFQTIVKRFGTKTFDLGGNVIGLGEKRAGGRAEVHAYPVLGVVTASLSGDEHQKLLASAEVEAVEPNELRFALAVRPRRAGPTGFDAARSQGGIASPIVSFARPRPTSGGPSDSVRSTGGAEEGRGSGRPFPSGAVPGQPFPFGAMSGQPFAFSAGPPSSSTNTANLLAYLAGQRDAMDAILARLGGAAGRPVSAPAVAAAFAAAGITWGLTAVGVSGAAGQMTGKGIKVAVLDTGVDLTHPDWLASPAATDPAHAKSFVQGVNSIQDGAGHGTHTAGTIAGPARSVGGTRYGVAPDCELFVGKVLDDSGSGFDSDILDGIQWAITNGCRVISMSLGSIRGVNEPFSVAYERVAQRLLDQDGGALIVAAAGNESRRSLGLIFPVINPAACPSIVSVAAVDQQMQIADFSCGQADAVGIVDFAGPGVGVYSSVPVSQNSFAYFDGTSMATPHVAAVAACMLQANPSLTPRALWDQLRAAAVSLPLPVTDVGRGLIHL